MDIVSGGCRVYWRGLCALKEIFTRWSSGCIRKQCSSLGDRAPNPPKHSDSKSPTVCAAQHLSDARDWNCLLLPLYLAADILHQCQGLWFTECMVAFFSRVDRSGVLSDSCLVLIR